MQSTRRASNSAIQKANPPFDKDNADLIIRSSDGIDFYVHKIILSLASSFFDDMLSLKQPANSQPTTDRPVVDVAEDGDTLYPLLSLVYPTTDPELDDLSLISRLLGAALKYDMNHPVAVLTKTLQRFRWKSPQSVYAIACRWDQEDVAAEAADIWRGKASKIKKKAPSILSPWLATVAGSSYVDEMGAITAGSFQRLLDFIANEHWQPSSLTFCSPPLTQWDEDSDDFHAKPITPRRLSGPRAVSFEIDHEDGDILIMSTLDRQSFRAHSAIISYASPALRDLVKKSRSEHKAASSGQVLPILKLPESGQNLMGLVHLCCPLATTVIPTHVFSYPNIFIPLAIKYKLKNAESLGKTLLQSKDLLKEHAVEVYFLAAKLGWVDVARNAAIHVARLAIRIDLQIDLESVDAKPYHALIKFQHEYRSTFFNLLSFTSDELAKRYWAEAKSMFLTAVDASPVPEATLASMINASSILSPISSRFAAQMVEYRTWHTNLSYRLDEVTLDL